MDKSQLNPIKDINNGIKKELDNVRNSLKSDWEDKIHDSYLLFVNKTSNQVDDLKKIGTSVERDFESIEQTKSVLSAAKALCAEANSL